MKNRLTNIILLCTALLLSITSVAFAAEIKGVQFADTHIVGQAQLEIRGVAVLKWAMLFNVYAGAFYLPEDHPGQSWADDVAKRLELSYYRNFKAAEFAETSDQLLKRNLSASEYQSLAGRLEKFLHLFQNVKPGDRYSLNYSPDRGTELRLNEQPLGFAPGTDFAEAYFGIWLGPQPINTNFRDRLLGD